MPSPRVAASLFAVLEAANKIPEENYLPDEYDEGAEGREKLLICPARLYLVDVYSTRHIPQSEEWNESQIDS